MYLPLKHGVLAGSGALCIAQAGATACYETKYQYKSITGTSGGALNACLIAVGYSIHQREDIFFSVNIPLLLDKYFGQPFTILDNSKMSVMAGDKLYVYFKKLFSRNGIPLTFKDTIMPLTVVATNVDKRKMEIFSTEKTPDMEIALAVRMSISIPGIFKPIQYNGYKYIDGGLYKNYFIDNYAKDDPDVTGFRIFDNNDFDPVKTTKELFFASLFTCLESNEASSIAHNTKATYFNLILDFDYLNFEGMTQQSIQKMYLEGYRQTKILLEKENK